MTTPLRIEIWSDLICPWCWIGKRRLEKALAAFPQRDQVRIVHLPYRLHPARTPYAAPQPVEALLASVYGMTPQQARAQLEQVERLGAAEGLDMRLTGSVVGDTLHGHRLVQFAATLGQDEVVLERLYRAYFSEGRSVFDRDGLLAIAVDAGLPHDAAAAVLNSTQYAAQVDDAQARAQGMGVRGVPMFLIGGRLAISGAQSTEHFTAALNQAWQQQPTTIVTSSTAGRCDDQGCELP